MLAKNTNAPIAKATLTDIGTTPAGASLLTPSWFTIQGKLLATQVPIPIIKVCITKPYERCSLGSLSATSARNGSMLMLIDASKTQSKPAAIHNAGECGTKNKASELKIAPIKK